MEEYIAFFLLANIYSVQTISEMEQNSVASRKVIRAFHFLSIVPLFCTGIKILQ